MTAITHKNDLYCTKVELQNLYELKKKKKGVLA